MRCAHLRQQYDDILRPSCRSSSHTVGAAASRNNSNNHNRGMRIISLPTMIPLFIFVMMTTIVTHVWSFRQDNVTAHYHHQQAIALESIIRERYRYLSSRTNANDVIFTMCHHDLHRLKNIQHIQSSPSTAKNFQVTLLGVVVMQSNPDLKKVDVEFMIITDSDDYHYMSNTLHDVKVSLFMNHYQQIGQTIPSALCEQIDSKISKQQQRFYAVTFYCSVEATYSITSVIKTYEQSQFTTLSIEMLLEIPLWKTNEWINLCVKNVDTALSKHFREPIKGDTTTRFRHTVVGCSKPLRDIDRLEKQWPGIMHQWIMYHVYIMGFGYLSVYDVDGSVWEYVKDFVDLGIVRYYGKFVWPSISLHANRDRQDSNLNTTERLPWNVVVNDPVLTFVTDNHCVWDSKGSSDWLMILRSPAYFVNGPTKGGLEFSQMLNQQTQDQALIKLEVISHDVRMLSGYRLQDQHNRKPSLMSAFPLVRLPAKPKTMMLMVDPNRLTSFVDGDLVEHDQTSNHNELRVLVRYYASMCINVTNHQQNSIGFPNTLLTDRTMEETMKLLNQTEAIQNRLLLQLNSKKLSQLEVIQLLETPSEMKISEKKLLIIGPALMQIPPVGWGAIENIIWQYTQELKQHDYNTTFTNTKDKRQLLKIAEELRPDIIHIHYDPFAHLSHKFSKYAKIVLITLHDGLFMDPAVWANYTAMFSNAASIACRTNPHIYFFVINSIHTDLLATRWNIPLDRIYLMPNGVEVDYYQYTKEPRYSHMSVCVGRISHIKGQYFLQSVLDQDEIHFIGPTEHDLSLSMFNTSDLRYLGHWKKVAFYERLTHYGNLVHLASHEGAPLVILEALAAGLGIVTTINSSANLDLSKPFITIIPDDKRFDKEYVVEAIRGNRAIAVTMRDEIREYARQAFSWSEVIVPKYVNLVEMLIKKQEKTHFPYNWALKYSHVKQMSLGIEMTSSPYIAVLVVFNHFSSKLVDWIDSLQLIGVDHFLFFTYSHYRDALKELLDDYIVNGVVELQYFDDFTYYQQLDAHSRLQVLDDKYFHILLNNEALAYFQIIGVTWMMLLFEQDYLFENMQSSAIVRDGLKYYLHQQDEREVDVIVQVGKIISKSNKNVSLLQDSLFHVDVNSRSIMRVATTVFHDELYVNCVDISHCTVDVTGIDNAAKNPFSLISIDIDYAWNLFDKGNIDSVDEEVSMFVEGVSQLYQELSYLRNEVIALKSTNDSNVINVRENGLNAVVLLIMELHLPSETPFSSKVVDCFFQMVSMLKHPIVVYTDTSSLSYLENSMANTSTVDVMFVDINHLEIDLLRKNSMTSTLTTKGTDTYEIDISSLMMSKIDLLTHAHDQFPGFSYYAFLDIPCSEYYGACTVGPQTIDTSKLLANKVMYSVVSFSFSSTPTDMINANVSINQMLLSYKPHQGAIVVVPNMLLNPLQQLWYDYHKSKLSVATDGDNDHHSFDIFLSYAHLFIHVRPSLLIAQI